METKEKVGHTPTPWEVGEYKTTEKFRGFENHVAVMLPDGSLLATTGPSGDKKSIADAEFIVRAVNEREGLWSEIENLREINHRYFKREKAHEALLVAAKKIVSQLDKATATPYMDVDVNCLRKAIAQAEGK